MPNETSFSASTEGASVTGKITDKLPVIPDTPPTGLTTIGPRVTIAPKGAWDEHATYEFYDAVFDGNGNSYIAKKPSVPAGTALADSEYWMVWTPGNQQLAELQNTVKTFDSRIAKNTNDIASLDSSITDLVNVCNVTKYGAVETDTDTLIEAIQKIINAGYRGAFIPAGKWQITKDMVFTLVNEFFTISGAGWDTELIVSPNVTAIQFNAKSHGNVSNIYIRPIEEYGKYTCAINTSMHSKITNCHIQGAEIGIQTNSDASSISSDVVKPYLGLIVDNCFIEIENTIDTDHGIENSIAILCGTDARVSNSRIWGYNYGISGPSLDSLRLTDVTFWQYWARYPVYAVYCNQKNIRPDNCISVTSCYFDGISHAYTNVRVNGANNIYYFNTKDMQFLPNSEYAIFNYDTIIGLSNRISRDNGFIGVTTYNDKTPIVKPFNTVNSTVGCPLIDYNYIPKDPSFTPMTLHFDFNINANTVPIEIARVKIYDGAQRSLILFNNRLIESIFIDNAGTLWSSQKTTDLYYKMQDGYCVIYKTVKSSICVLDKAVKTDGVNQAHTNWEFGIKSTDVIGNLTKAKIIGETS